MKSSTGDSTTTLSEPKSLSQLLEESDLITYLPMLNAKLKVLINTKLSLFQPLI